ncbi:TonB-dependent receptor plug domain-containing protein [Flavobacterium sp. F372]|uniref:TonB-dependent receptor plug domain-containing protein n=1 Tax=Flavobacterium bernardetii TaxID=2813823 RepID=A0ABR7IZR2_9FLAO|nr:TonB-dependent receptor plug domain-containing protein [Flavobacterium bernardetii]MBC5835284.1 TonB-dependent receptor plug domain-containing protein [Flavobacterium bernardetii]NHF69629.1 TonB-dependent receptor plug domain-containing protein [Flavobacterium bernardetii]
MKNVFQIVVLLLSTIAFSQQKEGVVTDTLGNTIENAYVYNETTKSHAHTNENGQFILDKTSDNDVLTITALGFKKKTQLVNGSEKTIILTSSSFNIEEIVISKKNNAISQIMKLDLQNSPVNSSQEILRKVPGLFIGQHGGGGKAEQIFLRGFDIDHGTDIALSVDGMPVNMVSHAHGQGYADLHFVIPETLDKIDFGKGSYYANKGDFATAGYVAFKTKEKIDNNSISLEVGKFNTIRTLGMFNLLPNNNKQSAFIASEYITFDGPYVSSQNFKRMNLFGKFTNVLEDKSKFSVTASQFSSEWTASGQIPQRLIDAGIISRFGAVDDTEGGKTSRSNLNVEYYKPISENLFFKGNTFYNNYQFELYSNFTFFLENPIDGDQIKQKENRTIYGFNGEFNKKMDNSKSSYQVGFGLRTDETKDSELSNTKNRTTTINQLKLGNISQKNYFSYINSDIELGNFTINPAVRFDYFQFSYLDKLSPTFQIDNEEKVKISPKLNFLFAPNNKVQYFLKSGLGFHSNDTRVIVSQTDKKTLPTSAGADLGTIFKPMNNLIINSALWFLQLEQEFVYVGDAGIVEPSGKTRRMGIDFGFRYQISKFINLNSDINYTYARSTEEPKGQNYIPLAPDLTSTGGISVTNYKGFSSSLNYRYLKSRPAKEDNSIVAKGYFVSDFNMNYQYKKINYGIVIENLFNTKWNETQFATESQLQNETQSVEEIHFTPGTPFFIKGKITYTF